MEFGLVFTNLLTLAGLCYGWMNPVFGLMVFYAFAILRPRSLWFWVHWPMARHSFYIGVATLVGWMFGGFGDWSGLRGAKLPVLGILIYLLCGLFTWQFTAINPYVAWFSLYPQITIVTMLLVTISLIRDEKEIKLFAWITTIALGYLAWVFNSQFVLENWNRVYWRGFGGIDNNGVAMIMVAGVPLTFFMGIQDKRRWVQGLCLFAALCLIHVVLFSFSRGGQLGLCIVGFAIFVAALLYLPNKGLTILAAIAFVIATLILAGREVREEFWSIFVDSEDLDTSAASRFMMWEAAWNCMLDNPLGIGPRNFNLVANRYGGVRGKSVHNLFLQTGADYGFLGAFGLMLFYGSSILNTFIMTTTKTAKKLVWPRYYGHMVSISLGGFLTCSLFVGMESVEIAYIIALIGVCTTTHVNRIIDSEAKKKKVTGASPHPEQDVISAELSTPVPV